MIGKIIKGIAGFYYVQAAGSKIYECKAKGVFRRQNIKPLVGDDVEIAVIDEAEKTGNIERVCARKNVLLRPEVANVDMALVIFAADCPKPNLNLLDRFLVFMQMQQVPVTVCFNKMELVGEKERQYLAQIYTSCGYPVLFTSAAPEKALGGGGQERVAEEPSKSVSLPGRGGAENVAPGRQERETGDRPVGITALKEALSGRTVAVAGPSGVGKSSIINLLQQGVHMETGAVSRKIARGRQTTRHSQLIFIDADTYIMDTPGFSSLFLPPIGKEELKQYYPEFAACEPFCRFQGCNHISEPDCGVKQALADGKIHPKRYENYCQLYEEIRYRPKGRML